MTYNERLKEIAEKMAKAQHHLKYESDRNAVKWEQLTELEKDLLIIQGKASARIAVAEMTKAYEWGHHDGWMSKAMNFNRLDSPSLKEGLIKSGLIPDDGQEAGSDD